MAVFTYRAMEAGGEVRGTIAADTPRQAREVLRGRGLVVRELADSAPAARRGRAGRWFGGVRRADVTTFVRELATLLAVGVPMLEALDTAARQHEGRMKAAVLLLRDRVASGASLAGAMAEQPGVFDELCANVAAVGEDAGTLDTSLERLAEFRERSEQLRGRIATALVYPVLVLTTALAASLFLMTFVVPRILEPLVEQGQELPLPTRVVKGASDFLLAWWWLLGSVVAVAGLGLGAALRTERGRLRRDRLVLRLPLLGTLARKQEVVRLAIVLGTLLRSGVVFLRALEVAQRTMGNRVMRRALADVGRAVGAGEEIAPAMERTGAFPPMVVQVVSLGQQSGRLEEMLDRLAATYDQQVQTSAQRLAAVLEPAVIVLLAGVVLLVVLATVLPILEAGNALQ